MSTTLCLHLATGKHLLPLLLQGTEGHSGGCPAAEAEARRAAGGRQAPARDR